jgi:predicted Zn finger-like uncharacterized protein
MLINCNSCQKKFVVPDSAIKESGRLVQCSACGSQWKQFPVKEKIYEKKEVKVKKKSKKKRGLYTEEYLKKKHGLVINDFKDSLQNRNFNKNKKKNGLGFYSYILILIIFLFTIFGILNLNKDIIVQNYPATEIYIEYLYETIDLIKVLILEFIN